jgi:hypothetical protein
MHPPINRCGVVDPNMILLDNVYVGKKEELELMLPATAENMYMLEAIATEAVRSDRELMFRV